MTLLTPSLSTKERLLRDEILGDLLPFCSTIGFQSIVQAQGSHACCAQSLNLFIWVLKPLRVFMDIHQHSKKN